jgi:tetratricopeptide (TPR) repeat protein
MRNDRHLKVRTRYDHYYEQALKVLLDQGSSGQVLQYVESIGDSEYRDATLHKIALHLVNEGRIKAAFRLSHDINDPLTRADAFFDMGSLLAKRSAVPEAKGAFDEAVNSANAIEKSTWECPTVLLQVSEELHKIGEKDQALQLLHRAIELAKDASDFDSAKVVGGCAVMLALWNYPDEAAAVAETISQPDLRALTRERLTEKLSS